MQDGGVERSPALQKELRFLGMDNISNKSAVDNLIAMGKAKGATAVKQITDAGGKAEFAALVAQRPLRELR